MKKEDVLKKFKDMRIEVCREGHFFGWYKDHSIDIERESCDSFYIAVHGDEGYTYDGYWRKTPSATMVEAIEEAITGSCLK